MSLTREMSLTSNYSELGAYIGSMQRFASNVRFLYCCKPAISIFLICNLLIPELVWQKPRSIAHALWMNSNPMTLSGAITSRKTKPTNLISPNSASQADRYGTWETLASKRYKNGEVRGQARYDIVLLNVD